MPSFRVVQQYSLLSILLYLILLSLSYSIQPVQSTRTSHTPNPQRTAITQPPTPYKNITESPMSRGNPRTTVRVVSNPFLAPTSYNDSKQKTQTPPNYQILGLWYMRPPLFLFRLNP
ncbi:hypothetical protein GE09DRAFT_1080210 [Coniochaeta sp. 2T2.1]|nr:hypothetical protein GE09DRAFT_1080210 [Coniochaeta sp. 2T2.1]